jgi:carboxypeptidase family protein
MAPFAESRTRFAAVLSLVFAFVLTTGSIAFAQDSASITGVVKDSSGAVLPGVTVEAASPALIEKVRVVVTGGTGQYRFEALRPGVYTVTFGLPGFTTVKQTGVELVGSFVATVNAELKVGAVAETVTVTSESPIVDVQSTEQQRVFQNEVLDSIPQGRMPIDAAIIVPGVTLSTLSSGLAQDVGGTGNITLTGGQMAIHGSSTDDHRQLIDGISTANQDGGGAYASGFTLNMGIAQEVVLDFSHGSAEQDTGGTYLNIVPKVGGNKFSGSLFATAVNGSFQTTNVTSDLQARGLKTPGTIRMDYDYNPGIGGPIQQDRLWFYGSVRWLENSLYVPGIWANMNAGNPNAWTYVPDLSQPGFTHQTTSSQDIRLTWQASPRNKIGFSFDNQQLCRCTLQTATKSNEAALYITYPVEDMSTVSWTAPITSRLLLEARGGLRREAFYQPPRAPEGDPFLQMIDVTEQGGIIPNLQYRSQGVYRTNRGVNLSMSTSLSYIVGSHAFKTGFSNIYLDKTETFADNIGAVSYRFLNGVPNQITQRDTPYAYHVKQPADLGIFVQDRWTTGRLTTNLGVRFQWYDSTFPAQSLGPGVLVPTRNISFPDTPLANFKDIVPRTGLAFDVFGNGKTAVKVGLNKYMKAMGIQAGYTNGVIDPVNGSANTVARSWRPTGTPATNPNYYVPQCNLVNDFANGDCGTVSDTNFGGPTRSTISAPATREGWGNRPFQWEFSAGVQQQLAPRVSVDVSYFRRWYGNFAVIDNQSVAPSDYSPFFVTAPLDPRLPDGGGYTVGPFFDLNPSKVGVAPVNVSSPANDYGGQIMHWNGVDATVNARLRRGILIQGGMSTGRTFTDLCAVYAQLPEVSPLGVPYCQQTTNFLTQFKALTTYTVPKVDVLLSAVFQSFPGPAISANMVVANAAVKPSLGRDLSAGAANVTVNLVAPGTLYGDRMNLLDLRFGKILKFGPRLKTSLNLDLYNALNTSAVVTENTTYVNATVTGWRIPNAIAPARFAKISVQLDF